MTLLITNPSLSDGFSGIQNSSSFGTFGGTGLTVANVYEPDPPGTSDFLLGAAQSDGALYTLTSSRAVVDPVFHVFNPDFSAYSFLGGLNPTILSGLNLIASANVARDPDGNGTNGFDNGGFADPNKGAGNGSGYGSFQLTGTFTSIQWTRPLVAGGFFSDGNLLGISATAAVTAVPEPTSLSLLGVGGLALALRGRRRCRTASQTATLSLRTHPSPDAYPIVCDSP